MQMPMPPPSAAPAAACSRASRLTLAAAMDAAAGKAGASDNTGTEGLRHGARWAPDGLPVAAAAAAAAGADSVGRDKDAEKENSCRGQDEDKARVCGHWYGVWAVWPTATCTFPTIVQLPRR